MVEWLKNDEGPPDFLRDLALSLLRTHQQKHFTKMVSSKRWYK